jgi:hypothetical protein
MPLRSYEVDLMRAPVGRSAIAVDPYVPYFEGSGLAYALGDTLGGLKKVPADEHQRRVREARQRQRETVKTTD